MVLMEFVIIELVIEVSVIKRATSTIRTIAPRELSLESIKCLKFIHILAFPSETWLPRPATVGVKCSRSTATVANHDFTTEVDTSRVRHQKIPVAKGIPFRLRYVFVRIQPFLFRRGNVTQCPTFDDEVDFTDFLLAQMT